MLEAGLIWKVGNGTSISARHGKWIPRPSTFQLLPYDNSIPDEWTVANLRTSDGLNWNTDILGNHVCQEDQELIKQIPVLGSSRGDKLIWFYTGNGLYSVKSGYKVAWERFGSLANAGSSSSADAFNWKRIWKMKVPPKIRVFLWKGLRGYLPVRERLCHKGLGSEQSCPRCGHPVESICHALLYCPVSVATWFASPLGIRLKEDQFSHYRIGFWRL